MFERLSALFSGRRHQLIGQAETAKKDLVEAVANSFGVALSPSPSPPLVSGNLTLQQFRAFECAYEALLERMIRGASGLAPDFDGLERAAISRISAGGWTQCASALSEPSLAARAAVAKLTSGWPRTISGSADDVDALKQTLARLRADESTEETTIRQQLFTHPACAEAFVHLHWRNQGHRTHTYFDIILGFEPPFAEALTEAMLADVVFQTFRRSFNCRTYPDRIVTGTNSFMSRDGISTSIAGLLLSEGALERFASENLMLPKCLLALTMYERML
jgi:hypothetical protein